MIKIVANWHWNSIFKNGFWEQNLIPSLFVICALAFNKCLLPSPFSFLFCADNVCFFVCGFFSPSSMLVILNRVSFENLWHFWCYWHLWEEKLRAAVHIMKVKSCLKLSEPRTEFCFLWRHKYFCTIFGHIAFSGTQLPGKLKAEHILFHLKLYQKSFAMDWITSPQNSHIEALNFCCYFKMEPLGSEVIKFSWGHVGGVLPVGSVSL